MKERGEPTVTVVCRSVSDATWIRLSLSRPVPLSATFLQIFGQFTGHVRCFKFVPKKKITF